MSKDIKLIPYKEIIKKKSLGYYYANRDAICKKNREKYIMLTPEQKKDRLEYKKRWYDSLSPERNEEMRQKRNEYNKDRYDNGMKPRKK